jgi:hypothetical protein
MALLVALPSGAVALGAGMLARKLQAALLRP